MKANRKFIDGEEAVSAVIGVILMVAITVAIAATVYVFVSGMMDVSGGSAPVAVIRINDGSGTIVGGADDATYEANDIVATIEHFSGDQIQTSEIQIEYKLTAAGTWTTLSSAAASGLIATIPDIFNFGSSFNVLAAADGTAAGSYFFRIRHNPSSSWIMTETGVTVS